MAFTLQNIRDKIRTSIHGRRFGLAHNDYLCGPKDVLRVVTNATSDTTGTNLLPYGLHTVTTTTNDGWVLSDPDFAGQRVKIATATTSTGNHAVTFSNATCITTNGVASSSLIMQGIGAQVVLESISTASWIAGITGGSTTAGATSVFSS